MVRRPGASRQRAGGNPVFDHLRTNHAIALWN